MKISELYRHTLTVGTATALLSGCGRLQPPMSPPGPQWLNAGGAANAPSGYHTLFSFNGTNGAGPRGSLLYFKGRLYGTTSAGGDYGNGGTVFVATTAGKEHVLHSFGQSGDGSEPEAGLFSLGGIFYGTTFSGGKNDYGTVFSITPGGDEKVLHRFGSKGDGEWPQAGLISVNGVLYGTTSKGGKYGAGTVFSITSKGKENVLHSFTYDSVKDGAKPVAGLIALKTTLYGTTLEGGRCYNEGTVFRITIAGKETLLHSFDCDPAKHYDGTHPDAGLIAIKDRLFGTASAGGPYQCQDGVVFSLTLARKEKILHNFCSSGDGTWPITSLIDVGGVLYGATLEGGASDDGTVYSITQTGKEKILHSFGTPPDGQHPTGGLTDVDGVLYGTTVGGGSHSYGTIYKISP
jgi:uncharacterized repeat protein (TIGR03803 family)